MIHDEKAERLHEGTRPPQVGRSGLGPQARKRIGTHLRAMYDSVVQQPVPDRFKDLVARLDDETAPRAGVERT